jgi:tetratricopeptide (TPR) repeat protein
MLPMPGAFDHVIVRAVIEGTEYWLDGTSSGASMAMVAEVPPFHHALPLRDGGAGLIPVTQRPQVAFDSESTLTFDHRAGLDVPMLVSAEWHLNGSLAAPVRAIIGQATDDQMDEFIHAFAAEQLGDGLFVDGAITFDEEANSATVAVRGLLDSPWEWERGRGTRGFGLPSDNFEFRPDRARAAWRDIPVAIPGPFAERMEMTVLLPEDSTTEYRLEGRDAFSEDIAGMRLSRAARLEEGRLLLTDSAAWPGGELSPADAAAARSRAIRFGSTELTLRAPANSPRRFAAASATDRTRFAAIEEVYAEVIADNPDDVANYRYRAAFRADTYDREGALADYNIVIDREPDAAAYLQRSFLHADLDRLEESLADAEAAWELDPSLRAVQQRAELLRYFDREEEAIALLEEQNASAEERDGLILAISDLEAETGRKAEGLQRLEELLAQRPGEPMLLNARCWYQATWNYRPEDLATICTEAVESSEGSPAVLDSRAMAYFRLGRYQDALKDLDAALAVNPDQTASLLLRGVVRREMGDSGGEEDIAEALARGPSLKRYFALFGITTR